jgi:DHA2 family multidrug resistance protein
MSDAHAPGLPPLKGMALAVTAIALALGTFMQVLDLSIANVAIPTIAGNLSVSPDQGTWVITSFAVANGVSVPMTGWLMTRYGVVRTFVASVILFTLASFLCGISWNLASLLAFRVLQGAVSGPMIPGSQSLMIMIFPPRQRGTALAIWSMTTLVAPVAGPVIGGFISDNLPWPWLFLINLPVGVICAFLCWRGMAGRETPTRKAPIDTVGFMLLATWVGAFQVMVDTGKDADWFNSPAIVVEALIAVIGLIAWVIWELNEENPIVDLTILRSRNFAIGSAVFCLSYAVFFGTNLLQPLWLQTHMGYIATWAGLVAAPSGVVAIFLTPFTARLMNRIDARWAATASLSIMAISFYMRSGFTPDVDVFHLVLPMLVQGTAMSFFMVSMITLSLKGIEPARIPAASGISNFVRITGGSFAASITTTVWDRWEAVHQTRLAETMTSNKASWSAAVAGLQHAGMSLPQAISAIGRQVVDQAYLLSTLDFFRVSAWLMIMLVPLIWLTARSMGAGATIAAAD